MNGTICGLKVSNHSLGVPKRQPAAAAPGVLKVVAKVPWTEMLVNVVAVSPSLSVPVGIPLKWRQ